MNLSICIITKNEEQNIDRCLKALAPYGLETIVVDTGSTDRTKQIAARYTDCRASGGGRPDPQAECVSQKRGGVGEPGVDQPHIRKRIFSLRGQDP